MRILYIVTAFPRSSGDVITPWLIETIKRLRERGLDVEVLAPSYRGSRDHVLDGIMVHRFRYAPAALESLTHDQTAPDRIREKPLYLSLVPGYVAAGAFAAARLCRSGRFDVVHAFWPLPHGIFGLAAHAFAGTPLVSTFFGVELSWLRKQFPILSPLVRAIVRYSSAVTVISNHTAAELRRLSPDVEARVIPFGAAIEGPDASSASWGSRAAGGEEPRLLFVGRLVERKGVGVLLSALALLRESRAVRLTVVGDGPMKGELMGRADALGLADAVDFVGFVSPESVAGHFAAADVFVLPAVSDAKGDVEGLGVVLIEALLHGVPVIASRSGGITDVVIDEETGLLVPAGDAAALAEAIGRVLDDPEMARRLAAAGRADVAERFSWDRITSDLEALYREVAGRSARGRGSPASELEEGRQ